MSNFYHRAARMLFPLVLALALLPWRPTLAQAAPPGAGVSAGRLSANTPGPPGGYHRRKDPGWPLLQRRDRRRGKLGNPPDDESTRGHPGDI